MSNPNPTTPRSSKGRGATAASNDTAVTELLAPLRDEDRSGAGTPEPVPAGSHASAFDATTELLPVPSNREESTGPTASAEAAPAQAGASAPVREKAPAKARSEKRPFTSVFGQGTERTALVVLVALIALAVAFIVLVFAGVSSASINALAVIVAPIASMVAAYYGITLSIQQVANERAEKQKALDRADAAVTAGRETEIWASQMESGLRVAMAKLNAAGIKTDDVTKAAGTPADFF
jgi:hypothetical protein